MNTKTDFEFRGVVRLTRIGAGYLVFTLLVGFAAINTGNNSLYIGLSFMLGSLILSGVASKDGLRGIEVRFVKLDEAWAGQPAWGVVEAVNGSRIWNVRDLVITSPELEKPLYIPILRRRSRVEVEGRFLFRQRGRVHFKTAALYTRYPFGLFLKRRSVSFTGEAVVFPRILDSPREPRRLGTYEGDQPRVNRLGPGSELFAFRDYVRGDSLRQVHWKKSASLGRWIMKQTELETGRNVSVAFDRVVPPGTTAEEFEELVSEATTLLHHALSLDLDVVLYVPPATLRAGLGSGRQQMLEAMALVEPADSGPVEAFEPGTFVFSLRRLHATRSA